MGQELSSSITWNQLDHSIYSAYGLLYILTTDLLLYPADLLTTRLQADSVTPASSLRKIKVSRMLSEVIRHDGIVGLYRGFTPTLIASIPGQAAYYASYEWLKLKINLLTRGMSVRGEDKAMSKQNSREDNGMSNGYKAMDTSDAMNRHTVSDAMNRHTASDAMNRQDNVMSNSDGLSKHSNTVISSGKGGVLLGLACDATAGLAAEAIAALAYLPADICSQRCQVQQRYSFYYRHVSYTSSMQVARAIWRQEGIRGFYRGYGAYLAVYGPASAVWWSSYEFSKHFIHKAFQKLTVSSEKMKDDQRVSNDGTSNDGTSNKGTMNHRIQSNDRANNKTASSEGIIGNHSLAGHDNTSWKRHVTHLLAGGLAGIAVVVATNPLDVCRTRLQLLEASSIAEAKAIKAGFTGQLSRMWRQAWHEGEGMAAFYKGMQPRIIVRVPASAVAFAGYELLKEKSLVPND